MQCYVAFRLAFEVWMELSKKINVIGTSGSGKSTFSSKLALKMKAPYIEMDALFWKPNWEESSDDEFFAKLESVLKQKCWVLDGNYTRTTPVKWSNVETVIWLDYSFTRTLYQAVTRAAKRSISRRELWSGTGNVETFKKSFFSSDSIILWTIKTYKANRIKYLRMMADSQYSGIRFVHIRSPNQAKEYLETLSIESAT